MRAVARTKNQNRGRRTTSYIRVSRIAPVCVRSRTFGPLAVRRSATAAARRQVRPHRADVALRIDEERLVRVHRKVDQPRCASSCQCRPRPCRDSGSSRCAPARRTAACAPSIVHGRRCAPTRRARPLISRVSVVPLRDCSVALPVTPCTSMRPLRASALDVAAARARAAGCRCARSTVTSPRTSSTLHRPLLALQVHAAFGAARSARGRSARARAPPSASARGCV